MDVENYYSEETDAAAAMAATAHPKFGRIMAPFTALIHDATAAFFHPDQREHRGTKRGTNGNGGKTGKEGRRRASNYFVK